MEELSDTPHLYGLYGSVCIYILPFLSFSFLLNFEWHKFCIAIQSLRKHKSIGLDFPLVFAVVLAQSRGHRVYSVFTIGEQHLLSMFTKWKKTKLTWKDVSAKWGAVLDSHHIMLQMSHIKSETHLQECLHRYKKCCMKYSEQCRAQSWELEALLLVMLPFCVTSLHRSCLLVEITRLWCC